VVREPEAEERHHEQDQTEKWQPTSGGIVEESTHLKAGADEKNVGMP
jgi:hypothetical protein